MLAKKSIVYLWPFQVLSILGVIYSFYLFSWQDVLLFFFIGHLLACVGQFIGLHRYFSHRSFKVNRFWHVLLVSSSTLSISGPVVAWLNIHRNHHKYSDTEKDPHSPAYRGMFNVFFANWWYYRYTPPEQIPEYKDSLLKFTHDYYYHINASYILLLALINPYLLFPLYFYPGILGPLMSSTVNSYLHRGGKPQDSKFLAYVICGDGYHKHHHDYPTKAVFPFPDLCGVIINLIRTDKST